MRFGRVDTPERGWDFHINEKFHIYNHKLESKHAVSDFHILGQQKGQEISLVTDAEPLWRYPLLKVGRPVE